ncbi:MAG: PCRF domain-containing protein, partial [Rhodobacterales bacterium]
MVLLDKLARITQRFEFLEARLSAGAPPAEIAALSREYSDLRPVVTQISAYRHALADLAGCEALLADPDMRSLAEDELPKLKARIPGMEQALRLALLPKDAADSRPAILEIRPGTGGEEAALFAADLLRMYQRHAEQQGWRFDILDLQESDLGGIRDVTAHVQGDGVFARLKYE